MRPVRMIGEAVLDLVVSGVACLLLYVALEELLRKPGHNTACWTAWCR